MPAAPVPTELRDDAFRGSAAVRAGLLTHRQLDGPSWRRLFRDVYVHAAVPVTHELRARAATVLLPDAVVTGRSAAVLWGVDLADTGDAVELTLPPGVNPCRVRGLSVRRAVLPREHLWRRRSVRVTTVEATALRLAGILPGDDAVVAVDQLLAARVIDVEPVRRLAAAASGPGSARARKVIALADGLAESPQETRLRSGEATCPLPSPNTACGSTARFARGWTSPGPNERSPSSTTGCGTRRQDSSRKTGAGSTHCRPRAGEWSS